MTYIIIIIVVVSDLSVSCIKTQWTVGVRETGPLDCGWKEKSGNRQTKWWEQNAIQYTVFYCHVSPPWGLSFGYCWSVCYGFNSVVLGVIFNVWFGCPIYHSVV